MFAVNEGMKGDVLLGMFLSLRIYEYSGSEGLKDNFTMDCLKKVR